MGLGTLTDGLARTPPMGWNSWNRFGPFVSDQLVRETVEALVESGMRDAGYRYVVVDDAWEGSLRSDDGHLDPNLWRFPNMRGLASYIHDRGLSFGLYTCAGDRTCPGYPGSRGRDFAGAPRSGVSHSSTVPGATPRAAPRAPRTRRGRKRSARRGGRSCFRS